jgi:hypothetical protein
MEFTEAYSSVVIVGEGFSPSIFSASKNHDILGEPDPKNQVIIPMLLQQLFPTSNFKVVITPERIDIGYSGVDFLPDTLKELSNRLINKFKEIENYKFSGIGLNFNVVIPESILGYNGTEFCKIKFLNIENIENKLDTKRFVANTAKLIYFKESIKYMVDIEPNFRSKGKDLHVKINAHQNCGNVDELVEAFLNYETIKSYLSNIHSKIFGKNNE